VPGEVGAFFERLTRAVADLACERGEGLGAGRLAISANVVGGAAGGREKELGAVEGLERKGDEALRDARGRARGVGPQLIRGIAQGDGADPGAIVRVEQDALDGRTAVGERAEVELGVIGDAEVLAQGRQVAPGAVCVAAELLGTVGMAVARAREGVVFGSFERRAGALRNADGTEEDDGPAGGAIRHRVRSSLPRWASIGSEASGLTGRLPRPGEVGAGRALRCGERVRV